MLAAVCAAVNKLLDSAAPGVEFTRRKYVAAHDAIVASAAYTHALEAAAHLLHKARACCLLLFSAPRQCPFG